MIDSELVYSTDPERNLKCLKCKKLLPECVCAEAEDASESKWTAVLRLETANRGGKAVTVIDKLPPTGKFLAELLSHLQRSLPQIPSFSSASRTRC